ncbi:MAG TPA: ATP synthase F1 subunit gamma [Turneriella sp.]|nr:ATP synthase F1 subunit gamma [Turneriella sp.]
MATAKEIRNRIGSVQNTKKITRTMELVSTAKAKKAVDKVVASRPYADKIKELIGSLASQGDVADHPLLRRHTQVRKALVVVVTANRGLCGGYNTNAIRMAIHRIEEYRKSGVEVDIHLIGKKAINYFNFQKIRYAASFTNIDDKMTFEDAQAFAEKYMESFSLEAVDKIDIVYTKYLSAATQKPVVETVLPVELSAEKEGAAVSPFIFEPDPQGILSSLLPKAITMSVYQSLLDAVASEQIARRIAMKSATDAASDMIKSLTLQYNRIRQAKITQEIAEIVGGAAAIQ